MYEMLYLALYLSVCGLRFQIWWYDIHQQLSYRTVEYEEVFVPPTNNILLRSTNWIWNCKELFQSFLQFQCQLLGQYICIENWLFSILKHKIFNLSDGMLLRINTVFDIFTWYQLKQIRVLWPEIFMFLQNPKKFLHAWSSLKFRYACVVVEISHVFDIQGWLSPQKQSKCTEEMIVFTASLLYVSYHRQNYIICFFFLLKKWDCLAVLLLWVVCALNFLCSTC